MAVPPHHTKHRHRRTASARSATTARNVDFWKSLNTARRPLTRVNPRYHAHWQTMICETSIIIIAQLLLQQLTSDAATLTLSLLSTFDTSELQASSGRPTGLAYSHKWRAKTLGRKLSRRTKQQQKRSPVFFSVQSFKVSASSNERPISRAMHLQVGLLIYLLTFPTSAAT